MTAPLVSVRDLRVRHRTAGLFGPARVTTAVDGVSFDVMRGETLALVGESGCGKTTTARAILRLVEADAGRITYGDTDLLALRGEALRRQRKHMQIVFQDPYTSLNPRHTVGAIVGEGLVVHDIARGADADARVARLLQEVGLDAADARRLVNYWADAGATSFKAYMHISRDELKAAAEEAHKRGMKITGHLCSVTYREAIAAGIDDLEHGFMAATDFVKDKKLDECPGQGAGQASIAALSPDDPAFKSLVAELVQAKTAVTSTLTVFESTVAGRPVPPGIDVLEPALLEQYQTRKANAERTNNPAAMNLLKSDMKLEAAFFRAGGFLVAGTDPTGGGGVIAGYSNQRQVELLVEAGLSPLEAIKVCTLNGATYLGIADRAGTIAAGKQADLVLIGGDPSATIGDIRKVETVFKQGVGYDPQKLVNSVKGKVGIF